MKLFLVGLGGFFGAISRFMIGEWLHSDNGFPLGTLGVNLLGCLVLGWFLAFAKQKGLRGETVLLIGTGFLGSFTTFSTFSVETVNLLTAGRILVALLYVLLSVFVGIILSFLGFKLAHKGDETV
ncbi:fluoride efflux transporter CrcB [Mesobacillus maritimus]|uniref:Fluoride-specific ion channel FluC n=1 Tax=Mesobacillus maritimus TaxID=1643336 RepID=A0ABS7K527_9BACI|nr:fluoride efflux transporter CrcB [Mesobacillus maritimus]MBY0097356.1 fluoride efflux transporter CrcB [Mesobacillus maritimus]